jgi:AcrR family transcriptional regulator
MSKTVKRRRTYDSPRRRAQAEQTRLDILNAARASFLERGYEGTTMVAIAEMADVVVETIYRSFGGKAGLFKAVVEAAVAGGSARAEVPIEERPVVQAMRAEQDPRRQLEIYAATQPGVHARFGPLFRVSVAAAAADPELAAVWKELEGVRLWGSEQFARLLASRNALRPGVSVEQARDVLWTINSHAVHDLLVVERGWSPERYRDWLTETLIAALLRRPRAPRYARAARASGSERTRKDTKEAAI